MPDILLYYIIVYVHFPFFTPFWWFCFFSPSVKENITWYQTVKQGDTFYFVNFVSNL